MGSDRPPIRPQTRRARRAPYGAVLVLASLVVFARAAQSSAELSWPARGALFAIAGCLLLSAWSPRLGSACASCGRATALVGELPVALLGTLLYAGLFVLADLGDRGELLVAGLWLATGAHVALLAMLLRARVTCLPCAATALLAFVATGLTVAQGGGRAWALALGPVGAIVTLVAARYGHARAAAASAASVRDLAARFEAEEVAIPEGHVRVLVYLRDGCPACEDFEAELRPALRAALGERLHLEERDAGEERTATPLLLVRGRRTVAIVGLPETGALERVLGAIDDAAAPARAASDAPEALRVIGLA